MKKKFKSLQIIHLCVCIIAVVFFLTTTNLEKFVLLPKISKGEIPYAIIPLIAFILSNMLFKTKVTKIDLKLDNLRKLELLKETSIIRWSILEFASIFIFITSPQLSSLGLLIIFYLFFTRPTIENTSNLLDIAATEFENIK